VLLVGRDSMAVALRDHLQGDWWARRDVPTRALLDSHLADRDHMEARTLRIYFREDWGRYYTAGIDEYLLVGKDESR